MYVYHDIRLPGGSWGPWQFASGAVVKAFRLNSYNNNVNNNNNGVNFNALNTANALNSVSLAGLGSLYGGNVLRPSVIYRCVTKQLEEFTFELVDLQKSPKHLKSDNLLRPRLAPAPKGGRSGSTERTDAVA